MTTNYNRSPLRSLYNAQGAQAASHRRLNAQQQRQLGGLGHLRQRPAMDTGMTDVEETKLKQAAVKKGAKYGYEYLTAPSSAEGVGSGIAGNNYAQDSGFETMDHANYDSQAATFDDAGGAEATNSGDGSSGDGGSYLGAIAGGAAGYGAGEANSRTDPAMTSGEDGFGRYDTFGWGGGYKDAMGNEHYDRRATIGGTIGGAYLGWEGAAPLSSAAVRWSHPYMQDMTRDVIMLGDRLGGPAGAMMLDPIGAMASGKYSQRDLAESAGEAALSGGLSLLGHSEPVKKFNDKIKDIFGW